MKKIAKVSVERCQDCPHFIHKSEQVFAILTDSTQYNQCTVAWKFKVGNEGINMHQGDGDIPIPDWCPLPDANNDEFFELIAVPMIDGN